jgi:outer membrane lipoprotein carrier protein
MLPRRTRLRIKGEKCQWPLASCPDYRVHAQGYASVIPFVTTGPFATRLAVCCALAASCALQADSPRDPKLAQLLRSVEARYNRAQSLKLDFSETYAAPGHPVQSESGTLLLRKPGRMRWDYSSPAGKIYLSDGKDVYLYTPGDRRVEKSKLKESEDMRAPLAFLLGKLNFEKEFREFSARPDGEDTWITAWPKSQNLLYTEVEFLASPDGSIRRVNVTGQDHSKLNFTFSNEKMNAPAPPALFAFHPPPGVEVVDSGQ